MLHELLTIFDVSFDVLTGVVMFVCSLVDGDSDVVVNLAVAVEVLLFIFVLDIVLVAVSRFC